MNKPELSFEIVYRDEHMINVKVNASNGRFAGATAFYTDAEGSELTATGERFKGFPKDTGQVVEVTFGLTHEEMIDFQEKTTGRKTEAAYSPYLHLKFKCIDNSGHTAVDIVLVEDNWTERDEARGKAYFEMRFDPASLDRFSEELMEMGRNKAEKAVLVGRLD